MAWAVYEGHMSEKDHLAAALLLSPIIVLDLVVAIYQITDIRAKRLEALGFRAPWAREELSVGIA